MFGGCPGIYEVTWDVYKRKDFNRLSFPASFILGEPCSMHITWPIIGRSMETKCCCVHLTMLFMVSGLNKSSFPSIQ